MVSEAQLEKAVLAIALEVGARVFRRCPIHFLPLSDILAAEGFSHRAAPELLCDGPPRHVIFHEAAVKVWEVVEGLTGQVLYTASEEGIVCVGRLPTRLPLMPTPLEEPADLPRPRGRRSYMTQENAERMRARRDRGALAVHHLTVDLRASATGRW